MLSYLSIDLAATGIEYYFKSNVNPPPGNGIESLIALRSRALELLTSNPTRWSLPSKDHSDGVRANIVATVIFLNNIAIYIEDILELVH